MVQIETICRPWYLFGSSDKVICNWRKYCGRGRKNDSCQDSVPFPHCFLKSSSSGLLKLMIYDCNNFETGIKRHSLNQYQWFQIHVTSWLMRNQDIQIYTSLLAIYPYDLFFGYNIWLLYLSKNSNQAINQVNCSNHTYSKTLLFRVSIIRKPWVFRIIFEVPAKTQLYCT